MLRFVKILLMSLLWICSSGHSYAQSSSQNSRTSITSTQSTTSTVKKKATLSFEDELVEGGTQKPELFYLFQKKNFNYKRLIKLRENFLPEMRRTSEDIQRVRGGN